MSRIHIGYVLFVLFALPLHASPPMIRSVSSLTGVTDCQKEGLWGAVKQVVEIEKLLENDHGRWVTDFIILSGTRTDYDQHGNQVSLSFIRKVGVAELSDTKTYTYNPQGRRLTEATAYAPEFESRDKGNYSYDTEGRIAGGPGVSYSYDASSRLVQREGYVRSLTNSVTTFIYDGAGKLHEAVTYDENGQLTERSHYDADNYPIREQDFFHGTTDYYRYDDHHNVIVHTHVGSGDILGGTQRYTFRYVYDAKGNWIKCTQIGTGDQETTRILPDSVTFRTITYYDDLPPATATKAEKAQ